SYFMGHFDVAWENLRIRIDERRAKRREARSDEISAAQMRAERRRDKREHSVESLPPTISVGDIEQMAAAAAVGRAAPSLPFADEPYQSVPTIGAAESPYETVKVSESLPDIKEIVAKSKRKAITLTPPIEEIDEDGDEDEDELIPLKRPAQSFEGYKLPTSHMLTPPAARIEQDEKELLAIAKELAIKTAEFSVGGRVVN
ncbi:MAG: hypothetical protein ABR530_02165, partial [Pyrinomonadaceae bacterium]